MSSFPLTFIFFKMVIAPPTSMYFLGPIGEFDATGMDLGG